jgi:hypothetical protein
VTGHPIDAISVPVQSADEWLREYLSATPSRLARKVGRANADVRTLCSFTAFSARVYSLAFSKGCKAGSRFRET